MHYVNYIRSYLNACTRKQTSRFPVSKQPSRMPNLIYIVTSSYNSQPCCFGIPIHPPSTPPSTANTRQTLLLSLSLSPLTGGGGMISAFVVEHYYFRERKREGLKERQQERERVVRAEKENRQLK